MNNEERAFEVGDMVMVQAQSTLGRGMDGFIGTITKAQNGNYFVETKNSAWFFEAHELVYMGKTVQD